MTTSLPLPGGAHLPVIGVGTWPLDDDQVASMLAVAFEVGYRLVDTAENYRNEVGVGRAVRASGLDRSEIFITTKFNKFWHADPVAGVQASLDRLGLDQVDLVLIHWPNPDQDLYVRAWQGLVQAREQGLTRAIGTSNFLPEHLDRLIQATGVAPEVNQLQCNPFTDRIREREYHLDHGIVTESWAPLGAGNGLVDHPVVQDIAEQRGATGAQVVLAWHLQQGLVPIPKSANPARLAENLAALDVALAADDITALDALTSPDYRVVDANSFGH